MKTRLVLPNNAIAPIEMNALPNVINFQSHQSKPPDVSISVEAVELSVQNLIQKWTRRQKWKLLCINNQITEQDLENRATWRSKLTKFIESTPIRAISISLLLLDLIFTILDLSSSLLSCHTPKQSKIDKSWYHFTGLAILSLLSIKSVALLVGLGRSFFRRPGFVFDAVVVTGALFLEALMERKGGGLIVVVSLWRVVRVVESAFELSDEAIESQIEGIVLQFEGLKEENTRLEKRIVVEDGTIEELQQKIEELERELNQFRLD